MYNYPTRFLLLLSHFLPARLTNRIRRRTEKKLFALKYGEKPDNLQLQPETPDKHTKKIAIKCPAPNWQKAAGWGDYHFARALQKSLVKIGHIVRLDILPDWYSAQSEADDIVLVLRGREKYTPSEKHINLMWNICHPDEISMSEFNEYDHVFISSETFLSELEKKTETPVTSLLQCSDQTIFYKTPVNAPEAKNKLLFVGNSRGELRPIVKDCLEQNLPLTLYGRDWHGIIPPDKIAGPFIPNNELHNYYANADIVLNDHWPDMARLGYISNRIFDIALAGGFVISDKFKGSEIFKDHIITYSTPEELSQLCNYWINHPEERREKSKALQEYVLKNHTFDQRARTIHGVIQDLLPSKV
ncbi:MAG: CgeB family protein [Methyloligellaceae bacterium]